jgi:methylmalonyl-CoA mutase N-terminal domain/subunit
LRITNEDERKQLHRLEKVRHDRDGDAVRAALTRLASEAADPTINLMPALIAAASAFATIGEMMSALEGVFGRHVEVPTL